MRTALTALAFFAAALYVSAAFADDRPHDGTLDVTATEPGLVLVDDAEYGPAPQSIEHIPAGPHRVTVRFDGGGETTRTIAVKIGQTTPVRVDLTAAQRTFQTRTGAHFSLGAEGVFSFTPYDPAARLGVRGFARLSYGVSPRFSVRADASVGYLAGKYVSEMFAWNVPCPGGDCYQSGDATSTFVPLLARVDAQIHLGSSYSMVFGVDFGVTVMSMSGTAYSCCSSREYFDVAQTVAIPTIGLHASFLTFSFGAHREFTLSLQQGAVMYFAPASGGKNVGAFEQTAGLSYRF